MAATQNAKDSQMTRFPDVIDVKLPNIRNGSVRKAVHRANSDAELPVTDTPLKIPAPFDRTNSKRIDVTEGKGESSPGRINQQMSIMSDRTSENDSKSSGSVVVTKKTAKNNA